MAAIDIPEQLTFRRREVMQLTKLDGRVLDYWETEFAFFSPMVNQSGEKFYSRQDLETILTIRQLLIVEKRDKESVRRLLNNGGQQKPSAGKEENSVPGRKAKVSPGAVREIRHQLREILTLLDKSVKK